jgi:hypothetical protein
MDADRRVRAATHIVVLPDIEPLGHRDQVETGFVQLTGLFELVCVQPSALPSSARNTSSLRMLHDRAATNAEALCQRVDLPTVLT